MNTKIAELQMLTPEIIQLRQLRRQYPQRSHLKDTISIITATNKPHFMQNIFRNYQQQNYDYKELIIILNNNQLNLQQWSEYAKNFRSVRVFQLDQSATLGECLNFAVQNSYGAYICKFDDDDYYGPNFLCDLMPCFTTTNAAIVGKNVHFVYFENTRKLYLLKHAPGYSFVELMPGAAQIIKREVFAYIKFATINIGEDGTFDNQCLQKGFRIYGADPFNFIAIRHSNPNIHTWKIAEQEYMKCLTFIAQTSEYKPYIIV